VCAFATPASWNRHLADLSVHMISTCVKVKKSVLTHMFWKHKSDTEKILAFRSSNETQVQMRSFISNVTYFVTSIPLLFLYFV
jgi:hypothetical protein